MLVDSNFKIYMFRRLLRTLGFTTLRYIEGDLMLYNHSVRHRSLKTLAIKFGIRLTSLSVPTAASTLKNHNFADSSIKEDLR